MKHYLFVPFAEKDQVKRLGARWDPNASRWYVREGEAPLHWFERWNVPPITDFPGEDRTFGGGSLFVDLIPASCWFVNARSALSPIDWERVRLFVYARADHTCEICGVPAIKHLEAHERWHYDEHALTQKLMRLIAICSDCHRSTHFGSATLRGEGESSFLHLKHVNGWDDETTEAHIADAFTLWRHRNQFTWALDLSILGNITLTHPSGGSS